jgi:hypothetical protein
MSVCLVDLGSMSLAVGLGHEFPAAAKVAATIRFDAEMRILVI